VLKNTARACLVLLFCVAAVWAQRDLGTIVGTVADASGAAIPAAKIVITEDSTGLKYQMESGAGGDFVRPALKPGTYSVEVEAQGFKKALQKNVVLTAGDRIAVNVVLTVGEISQSVEVTESVPLLQTESTVLGSDLNAKQMNEIPLGGQRTFTYLARLSPGVVPAEPGARDAVGGGFSANGVRSNGQNNFLLNGVDNNVNVIDFLNQASFVVGPSVEAISEMRVMTNGYNAEYGRGAGGVLQVNLKSGTNQIHGSVFEYLQNNVLNANRWENNKNGQPRGAYQQNQFGFTVGGPAIKNKLFWFGDYQGTRLNSQGGAVSNLGTSGYFTIPTQAMIKNGDYSQLLGGPITGPGGEGLFGGMIFDPHSTSVKPDGTLTRTPYAGNIIPQKDWDPSAVKIMGLFPATNVPLVAGFPLNDYFVTTKGNQTVNQFDVRADYQIGPKDTLFGSFSWSNANKVNNPPLPGALDATYFNSAAEQTLGRNAMLSYTHVFTPTIISETRLAYTRLVTSRLQANADTDEFAAYGIGGYNPTTSLNGGLPSTSFYRYSGFGASDWLPSKEYSNVWDFIENVSWNKGSHAFKFGFEYRPIQFPFFQVPSPHGNWYFSQVSTSYPSATNNLDTNTGDAMASFMTGQVYNGQMSTTNFISSTKSAMAVYAQDDWKVNSKLTINYGIRYELFSPIGEKFSRQSNFVQYPGSGLDGLTLYIPSGPNQDAPLPPNFAQQFPQVKVSRGQVDQYLIPWDKYDWSPRIGFAYAAKSNLVIRAGYGIFYGGEENQGGNPNRGEAAPFNETVKLDHPSTTANDYYLPNPAFPGGVQGGFPLNIFSGYPAPIEFRGLYPNFRNPMVQKWNVAVQYEFKGNNAVEVAYVGNHQSHALLQPDPNAALNSPIPGIGANARRPYPNIGNVQGTATFGFGNYAGMTAQWNKRYSHGLIMTMAYTYGHALATSGTTLTGSSGFGTKDPGNLSLNYSSAAWDVRQNFVTSVLYDLPFGKGKKFGGSVNKATDTVLGGWQMNVTLVFRNGAPYTLRSNYCIASVNSCFPDAIPGRNPNAAPSGGRTPSQWIDIANVIYHPAVGTEGNLGMQTNYEPGNAYMDFALFKGFNITERWKMQFRWETFNLTNTPQFGNVSNNVSDSNFGQITSTQTGTERKMQMSLRLMF
jgi:hypothetical protein